VVLAYTGGIYDESTGLYYLNKSYVKDSFKGKNYAISKNTIKVLKK
jgi:hypothetical protein